MSAHVLLNLKTSQGKAIKVEACRALFRFLATSLINSILSYAIRITLKVHFWRLKVKILSYCTQRCY